MKTHDMWLDQKGQPVNKYFPFNLSVISGFALEKRFNAEKHGITALPVGHDGGKIFYEKDIESNVKFYL